MIQSVNTKIVPIILPAGNSGISATLTSATVDTQGYDYLEVYFQLGVTDAALTALVLQSSDLANFTGGANVAGTKYGTDVNDSGANSTLPSNASSNQTFKWEVDLRGQLRFWEILAIVGGAGTAGAYAAAWAVLSRAQEIPTTATAKNVNQVIRKP